MGWKKVISVSNYPPGETGSQTHGLSINCKCEDGHTWSEPAYFELGGTFLENEEPDCPTCGKPGEPE